MNWSLLLLVLCAFAGGGILGAWYGYCRGYAQGEADTEERVHPPSRW